MVVAAIALSSSSSFLLAFRWVSQAVCSCPQVFVIVHARSSKSLFGETLGANVVRLSIVRNPRLLGLDYTTLLGSPTSWKSAGCKAPFVERCSSIACSRNVPNWINSWATSLMSGPDWKKTSERSRLPLHQRLKTALRS